MSSLKSHIEDSIEKLNKGQNIMGLISKAKKTRKGLPRRSKSAVEKPLSGECGHFHSKCLYRICLEDTYGHRAFLGGVLSTMTTTTTTMTTTMTWKYKNSCPQSVKCNASDQVMLVGRRRWHSVLVCF